MSSLNTALSCCLFSHNIISCNKCIFKIHKHDVISAVAWFRWRPDSAQGCLSKRCVFVKWFSREHGVIIFPGWMIDGLVSDSVHYNACHLFFCQTVAFPGNASEVFWVCRERERERTKNVLEFWFVFCCTKQFWWTVLMLRVHIFKKWFIIAQHLLHVDTLYWFK